MQCQWRALQLPALATASNSRCSSPPSSAPAAGPTVPGAHDRNRSFSSKLQSRHATRRPADARIRGAFSRQAVPVASGSVEAEAATAVE